MPVFSKEIPKEAVDAFKTIFRENRSYWLATGLLGAGGIGYYALGRTKKSSGPFASSSLRAGGKKKKRYEKALNKTFWRNLRRLLKIAIPSIWSQEVRYLAALAFFLVIRTMLSIKIADVNGTIVRSIVNRQFWQFVMRIATLGSIAIPASFVNSWLSYYTARLALQFRSRLVRYFHDLYLQPRMYYKLCNVDQRIHNPDQAMTETLTLWGKAVSELYNNITKPLLDIVLFSLKLAELMGWQGPGSVLGYYAVSLVLIRLISPPFGTLARISQKLEGNFRASHHRLITHSEEIAFYSGHDKEKELLNRQFRDLERHQKYVLNQKFGMGAFNGFLQKYGSVMCGYTVLGLPVFGRNRKDYLKHVKSTSDITQDYIRNSSLLINLSKAIGRIVTSYEDLQRLAGYTAMVTELETVLVDLSNDKYTAEMVEDSQKALMGKHPFGGAVKRSDKIDFDRVSIVTPNGDLLVKTISFKIERGDNLMIVGPNGCGKSSLFRILGELWPTWDGELTAPHEAKLFYIPQKPYLSVGSFRDQLIYPHSKAQMAENHVTDEDLAAFLAEVKLGYLLDRHGGWDVEKEWFHVLSGGEKQRIAMARVFYHRPDFAILDECTSAVSVDVEAHMYQYCKDQGITLITISHRPSLWVHHEKKLTMDGRGSFEFGPMILPADYKTQHA